LPSTGRVGGDCRTTPGSLRTLGEHRARVEVPVLVDEPPKHRVSRAELTTRLGVPIRGRQLRLPLPLPPLTGWKERSHHRRAHWAARLDWPISPQQVGPRATKVFDVLESFRLGSTAVVHVTSWPASTSARTETGLTTLFQRRTPPTPGIVPRGSSSDGCCRLRRDASVSPAHPHTPAPDETRERYAARRSWTRCIGATWAAHQGRDGTEVKTLRLRNRVAWALDERAGRCGSVPDANAPRRRRSPPLAGETGRLSGFWIGPIELLAFTPSGPGGLNPPGRPSGPPGPPRGSHAVLAGGRSPASAGRSARWGIPGRRRPASLASCRSGERRPAALRLHGPESARASSLGSDASRP
jgi:hypothetical protein